MSNVREIVAELPNLKEYSLRLAEKETSLPPPNTAIQVLFAVACHVLPVRLCKLKYEDFRVSKPEESPESVQRKGRGDVVSRYQRTFMEKWRAISMMAKVVGMEITAWDCYNPSHRRWARLVRSINRYLRFRMHFRSLESLKTHLNLLPKDKKNSKLEEVRDGFARAEIKLKSEKERIGEEENRALTAEKPRMLQLGVIDSDPTSLLEVLEVLKNTTAKLDFDNSKLKQRTEYLASEKAQTLTDIEAMKKSIPDLKKKLGLLRKLRSNGAIQTKRDFEYTNKEIGNLQGKTDSVLAEINSIAHTLTILTDGLNVIAKAKKRWEKCNSNIEVPNSSELNEQIGTLNEIVKGLKADEDRVRKEHAHIEELVKRERKTIAKSHAVSVQVGARKSHIEQTKNELSKRSDRLKKALSDDKQAIKVADNWLVHLEKAKEAHKLLLNKREDIVGWLESLIKQENPPVLPPVLPSISKAVQEALDAAEASIILDMSLHEKHLENQLEESFLEAKSFDKENSNEVYSPTRKQDDAQTDEEVEVERYSGGDNDSDWVDGVGIQKHGDQPQATENEQSFLRMDSDLQPDASPSLTSVKNSVSWFPSESPSHSPSGSPIQSSLRGSPKRRAIDPAVASPEPNGAKRVKFTSPLHSPIKQRLERSNTVYRPTGNSRDQTSFGGIKRAFSAFEPEQSDDDV